jgi:hypothetical protein
MLLNLRQPRILRRLHLQLLHMRPCISNRIPRPHQRPISLPLSLLCGMHAFLGSEDGGVHFIVVSAEETALMVVVGVSGVGGVVGGGAFGVAVQEAAGVFALDVRGGDAGDGIGAPSGEEAAGFVGG